MPDWYRVVAVSNCCNLFWLLITSTLLLRSITPWVHAERRVILYDTELAGTLVKREFNPGQRKFALYTLLCELQTTQLLTQAFGPAVSSLASIALTSKVGPGRLSSQSECTLCTLSHYNAMTILCYVSV